MHVESLRSSPIAVSQIARAVVTVIVALLTSSVMSECWAQPPKETAPSEPDVMALPIEQLLNIEVTTAARRPQSLAETAAAVFVITQDDIRRSGVTSIAEALRLAPGVQVARIDANKWAITIRGFSGRFANKLLVLIDGRTVYSPLFAGVYWDVQDTLLDDIDRIEVIRGPASALWGANAVNGIINIITKQAGDTKGGLAKIGGGSEEHIFGGLRYGVGLGENATIRVYGKGFKRDDSKPATDTEVRDGWHMVRGGLRLDWQASARDLLTVQGDIYRGDINERRSASPSPDPPFSVTANNDLNTSGGNVLARWERRFSDASDLTLQFYYDRTDRDEKVLREIRDTIDLDFQHRFRYGPRLELLWGLGYRFSHDDFTNSFVVSLDPENRDLNLFSAFVQGDLDLIEDQLRLTLGSKFEHNDFTGFEYQPNIRLLWTPAPQHTAWAAISRAVRTPSRQQDDILLRITADPPGSPTNPGPFPAVVTTFGNRASRSEKLLAFELGYRVQPIDQLSVDITAFYNDYNDLETFEPGVPFVDNTSASTPLFVIPLVFDNKLEGETFGLELVVDWRPLDWWRLQTVYSYLQVDLSLDGDSGDTLSESREDENPRHQLSFRSSMNFPRDVDVDIWLRYVSALSPIDVSDYVTMDIRLAWRPVKSLELEIVGQNLAQNRHEEFAGPGFIRTEVQRGVYGKITWRF